MKTIGQKSAILRCLMEGASIASTARITGAAENTIAKLLREAGEACEAHHDRVMVKLPCAELQLDEIWSFVGCKEKNKENSILRHPGDMWTWTAICPHTRLMPRWLVSDRSGDAAFKFCADLAKRFTGRLQITTDGNNSYRWAVGANFEDVDFAQLIKVYGKSANGFEVVTEVRKEIISGNPSKKRISTCTIERSNLMVRTVNRRFTRLTNGFSKKAESHRLAFALTMMAHNFCRKHGTMKMTPAQAAGLTDHAWSPEEVVEMVEKYLKEKETAAFEEAFARRWAPPRTTPKSYPPTPKDQIPVPWYLDKNSPMPEDPRQRSRDGGQVI